MGSGAGRKRRRKHIPQAHVAINDAAPSPHHEAMHRSCLVRSTGFGNAKAPRELSHPLHSHRDGEE
jgi:hypothetical protein